MTAAVRILVVSDSADDVALLVTELERGGYRPFCKRVDSRESLIEALSNAKWDAILSDFQWNGFGALPALTLVKERELDIPFLIISDTIGEETAVRAIKAGAHNCISKKAPGRLAPALERELRESQIRHERHLAQKALRESEARFRTLAETASDVILTINPAGQILFANRAAERVFGCPVPALIGEPLTRLLPDFPIDHLGEAAVNAPDALGQAPVVVDGRRAEAPKLTTRIRHQEGWILGQIELPSKKPSIVPSSLAASLSPHGEEARERRLEP